MSTKHLKIQQVANFPPRRHIHMVGIGGCGMSPLAHILIQQGYIVSGSDLNRSNIIKYLESAGIQIALGHDAKNIQNPDVVVYSSAIAQNNPELMAAHAAAIPVIPRSRLLADMMALKHSIVVAGSHGKTSTTGLIFWGLQHLNQKPSLIFGGRFQKETSSARLGNGPFMVVESDESDKSFLMLNPTVAVLTNIDHEHVGPYGDFETLKQSFLNFMSRPPFYGFSVLSADCAHSRDIAKKISHRKITFGFSKDSDVHIENISGHHIHLKEPNQPTIDIPYPAVGDHVALNLSAAYATLREIGFTPAQLQSAFKEFPGIQRRLEKMSGSATDIQVWDDYAHHPTELHAVLKTIKHIHPKHHKLWLIFQPHRYTRFQAHALEFAKAIQMCDHVVVLPVYEASESPTPDFESCWIQFLNQLKQHHVTVTEIKGSHPLEKAELFLKNTLPKHTTVICCGAGDNTLLSQRLGHYVQSTEPILHEQPNRSA
jgi:UDP-N-acetylmuramate--alanine ligase